MVLSGLVLNRTSSERLFGLIRIVGYVTGDVSDIVSVEVHAGSASAVLPASECLRIENGETAELTVNVVTHLLSDGPTNFEVKISCLDGRVFAFPPFSSVVENNGALADAVRSDLKVQGVPVIFGRVVDASMFPFETGRAKAWFDQSDAVDVPLSFSPARDNESAHRHLEKWGFCVLPEVLPERMISAFRLRTC